MRVSQLFNWNARQFEAARFGLITALFAVVVATIGMELTWRAMSSETQGFIEQSIGDTASMVAGHVRSELEATAFRLRQGAELLLRPGSEKLADLGPDVMQMTVWSREGHHAPVRMLSWMHPKFRFRGTETLERSLIESSYHGAPIALSQTVTFAARGALWLAMPFRSRSGESRILTAYLPMLRLERIFRKERLVSAMVIDRNGMVVGHPEGQVGRSERLNEHALVRAVTEPQNLSSPSLQMRFDGLDGSSYYGGYQRVDFGGLAILSSVSDAEARAGLSSLRMRSVAFIILTLFVTFAVGFAYSNSRASRDLRRRREDWPVESSRSQGSGLIQRATPPPLTVQAHAPAPQRGARVLVFGTLRGVGAMVEKLPQDSLLEGLNDAMTLCSSRVREFGGTFEFHSGFSFNAIFSDSDHALNCILELRRDFGLFNASRKVDGHRELYYGFGAHAESALMASVGPAGQRRESLLGDAHEVARALEALAELRGVDVLVTHSVLTGVESRFAAEKLLESRLTERTGLCDCHWLEGFRDEQGQPRPVTTPYARVAEIRHLPSATGARRWLVNNGTQIVGPLDADAIAAQLFAQELDLDSECWQEGTGVSSRIGQAGIFGSAESPDARTWAYDGKTLHGPLATAFVITALERGALSADAWVCEGSTVSGWIRASEWRDRQAASASETTADTSEPNPAPKVA